MKTNPKFLATNRGRIIGMIRQARCTVAEMAKALKMTENGVRAHLSILEEEGLVSQTGSLPGTRKPFHIYELTAEGERLFPKSYGPLLAELLKVLSESLTEQEMVDACKETGKRLAAKLAPNSDRLAFEQRVALALEVLASMGAVAALQHEANGVVIAGSNCPIAEAVRGSDHACQVAQGLLCSITGSRVDEHCAKGSKPQCRFVIKAA